MTKKKTRKAIRFSTVKLKLTRRQKKSLENYCKSRGTTPLKVIKKSIRPLLENYSGQVPAYHNPKVKQLDLFHEELAESRQLGERIMNSE
jgi:hypothetical protein